MLLTKGRAPLLPRATRFGNVTCFCRRAADAGRRKGSFQPDVRQHVPASRLGCRCDQSVHSCTCSSKMHQPATTMRLLLAALAACLCTSALAASLPWVPAPSPKAKPPDAKASCPPAAPATYTAAPANVAAILQPNLSAVLRRCTGF